MKKKNTNTITFINATYKKLSQIANIKKIVNRKKFDAWFNYKYKISESEDKFIKYLIEKNQLYLFTYNENKLIVKFIAPLINKIDFDTDKYTDWYGSEISCETGDYILQGKPDLMVATGIDVPATPYFFLQEYKRAVNPTGNPEYQVLAAMLASLFLNDTKIIRGSYVVGQIWKFVILEKLEDNNYEYFVSDAFDCLQFNDLIQIYINLQAVKFLYCK